MEWKFTITAAVLVLLLFIFVRPYKVDADRRRNSDEIERRQPPLSALNSEIRSKRQQHPKDPVESGGIVTGTWGALRKQAPIPLPGGGNARIGLEATSAPASSGVLIYCLVDGSDQSSRRSVTGFPPGPFSLRIPSNSAPNKPAVPARPPTDGRAFRATATNTCV